MPNVNDLKKSRFLAQKDVDPPVLATIIGYEEINVAVEGAEPNYEWILNFKELEKPLILKPTNGGIIETVIGSKEFKDWIGHKIVLYVEPTVSYAGKITGGIRVRAPRTKSVKEAEVDHSESEQLADEITGEHKQEDEVPF